MSQFQDGLKQRIQSAKTQNEISALLKEGEAFTDASKDTRRKWQLSADKRINELTAKKAAKAPAKVSQEEKKTAQALKQAATAVARHDSYVAR